MKKTIIISMALAAFLFASQDLHAQKKKTKKDKKAEQVQEQINSVIIGNQEWMSENLNVEYFLNGDPIPHVKDDFIWFKAAEKSRPGWCYYNNDPANGVKYGRLYNYATIVDPRGLCPEGWHVPSEDDWKALEISLGMKPELLEEVEWRGTDQGDQLKPGGTSGFNAVAGGRRWSSDGEFMGLDKECFFWSATTEEYEWVWIRLLENSSSGIFRAAHNKGIGYSVRCLKESGNVLTPIISIVSTDHVLDHSANVFGRIWQNGGAEVTEAGVYLGTSPEPEKNGQKTKGEIFQNKFAVSLSGLSATTVYYIKVYAINQAGESTGEEVSFITSDDIGIHIDPADEQQIKRIKIGEQVWMAENLDVSLFRNGDSIPQARTRREWYTALEEGEPAWCYYEFDALNNINYGKLYNVWTMTDERGLAPEGWHVPSDTEWQELELFLGMSPEELDDDYERGAGKEEKLKAVTGWKNDNGGTNSTGFSAFPAGDVDEDGYFDGLGESTCFWSCEIGSDGKYYVTHRFIGMYESGIYRNLSYDGGYSIRCITD